MRRRAAAIDLRTPPIAVWPGEVVLVAVPEARELNALLRAACDQRPPGPVVARRRVAEAPSVDGRRVDEVQRALAAAATEGAAVLAAVRLSPRAADRRTLAALRLGVARRVSCRCVWLVGGRVYPE